MTGITGSQEAFDRIAALERELAGERQSYEVIHKMMEDAERDRDEAHAAIRALKGKAIHLDNGYRYCVLCYSAPAHRAEDVQHNPQCPIPKHAAVIRRAMEEGDELR